MKRISFLKYTSYGNVFVIVDEIHADILTESEKSRFAYKATNIHYGVGSDNFLVIQSCSLKTLKEINKARHYWNELPDSKSAGYIFRMFEPNGKEAFSCGNGLMCIADYLNHQYGIESARIMTEIPTARPKVISIGTNPGNGTSWANMGDPRRIPPEMVDQSFIIHYDDTIDTIRDIEIQFRVHDLEPFSKRRVLKLFGYLVFTGEPHLVIFSKTGFSLKELPRMMFISSCQNRLNLEKTEKRISFGSWLVHHIGTYINKHYTHIFPVGININFVQVNQEIDALEYRCFERVINRETLACGTGALAAAFVVRRMNLINTDRFIVWPHRCRWDDPEAEILVEEDKRGWFIYGYPDLLFKGRFMPQRSDIERGETLGFQKLVANQISLSKAHISPNPPAIDYQQGEHTPKGGYLTQRGHR